MNKVSSKVTHQKSASAMPSGNEMLQIMNNLNLAYKAEVAMSKLITILLWTGVSEFLLFCGTFITFCASPLREGIVWLQVVHLARGVLGIILAVKLPRSH